MCDAETHLGQFISSADKRSVVNSAKSFWRSLNSLMFYIGGNCYILSNVN